MEPLYRPQGVEERWQRIWEEEGWYAAEPDPARERFVICIPPPNVTGDLHMGHALNASIQDALIRWHRMRGFDALWQPGYDPAGIATQAVVERELAKEGLSRRDLGREKFVERTWEWLESHGGRIMGQLRRLGASLDYRRERMTLDPGYVRAVLRWFVHLHERGYLYRANRIVNWCPGCASAVSDLEVKHEDANDTLYRIRYPLAGGSGHVTIATVRPPTMLADVAVAVHSDDERYRDLVGKEAVLPIVGRRLPIVAGERVVARLEEEGLLESKEPYRHAVAYCDRSGDRIEPLVSLQWWCSMTELAKPAIAAVREGRVRFRPDRYTKVYLDWMENIRDWCISRQLWWGHQIPAWYCANGHTTVAESEPSACAECGSRELTRDEDVLDTWFSSALWPFAILGWPDDTPELRAWYPGSLNTTAREIIRLWENRMIFSGLELVGEIPFRDVIIHTTVLAPDGRRMSKSLGTGMNPLDLVDEHGADATRYGLLKISSSQDVRFSFGAVEEGRKLANKLWNASRLLIHAGPADPSAAEPRALEERWIAARLDETRAEVEADFGAFDFAHAVDRLYHLTFDDFCDWYLEAIKPRLGEPEVRATAVAALG